MLALHPGDNPLVVPKAAKTFEDVTIPCPGCGDLLGVEPDVTVVANGRIETYRPARCAGECSELVATRRGQRRRPKLYKIGLEEVMGETKVSVGRQELRERLRAVIAAHGLKQADVARGSSVGVSRICAFLSGRENLGPRNFEKLRDWVTKTEAGKPPEPAPDDQEVLRERLRAILEAQSMAQKVPATALRCHPATISGFLHGNGRLGAGRAKRLEKWLSRMEGQWQAKGLAPVESGTAEVEIPDSTLEMVDECKGDPENPYGISIKRRTPDQMQARVDQMEDDVRNLQANLVITQHVLDARIEELEEVKLNLREALDECGALRQANNGLLNIKSDRENEIDKLRRSEQLLASRNFRLIDQNQQLSLCVVDLLKERVPESVSGLLLSWAQSHGN